MPLNTISQERIDNIIRECGNTVTVTVLRNTPGPRSSFITEEKRARLKSNPVKVHFAEEVIVNGQVQGNSLLLMPGILKVYLENGQTKAFRFEKNTTVKDIILTLKSKLSIRCIEHFALVLKERYTINKIYILHDDELIEQVVQKREPRDYRCLFRVCFLPRDPLVLLQDDPVTFEYLYSQSCNDVLLERFAMEMKYSTAIRLAALQIQECILSSNHSEKVSMKYIEDWGIENFVSSTVLDNMKEKDIRKAINYHLKNNHSLIAPGQKQLISTAQVRLNYLNILSDLRAYGGKTFNATLLDSESFITLLVGAKYGISEVVNSKLNIINQLTDFNSIQKLELTFEYEKISVVNIYLVDVKSLTLVLETRHAKDLVYLIAGYHRLYVNSTDSIFIWPGNYQSQTTEEDEKVTHLEVQVTSNSVKLKQFLYLRRICSNEANFNKGASEMSAALLNQGFPNTIVNKALNWVLHLSMLNAAGLNMDHNNWILPLLLRYPFKPPLDLAPVAPAAAASAGSPLLEPMMVITCPMYPDLQEPDEGRLEYLLVGLLLGLANLAINGSSSGLFAFRGGIKFKSCEVLLQLHKYLVEKAKSAIIYYKPNGSHHYLDYTLCREKAATNERVREGDENVERGNWSSKIDYLLSVIGSAVGLGNVWRFPYLAYRNGGGAFLIPYILMLAVAGMPMFFLETSFGQFASLGPDAVWKAVPMLQGLGINTIVLAAFDNISYTCVLAYSLYYLFASFQSPLPWAECFSWWGADETCSRTPKDPICNFSLDNGYFEIVNITWLQTNNETCRNGSEISILHQGPSEQYWDKVVLRRTSSIDETGEIVWYLALCLFLAWLIIGAVLSKGIKSSGKVVYFTATLPYVILTILLIRGLTLEGASKGIEFYIGIQSDFSKLAEGHVWKDAAIQIFFSLSVGSGTLIALSSYNKFHNNCYQDAIVVCVVNCGTSVFAGFAIFSILGHMAHIQGKPVSEVAQSGFGLAFIAYPEIAAQLPWAPLWSILFFLMLVILAIDTMFASLEKVITVLLDRFPKYLRSKRFCLTIGICVLSYLFGLVSVTQAGIYWIHLIDYFCAGWVPIIVTLLELMGVSWLYGTNRFIKDIEMMIGERTWLFWLWWRVCWFFITPCLMVVFLFWSLTTFVPPTYGPVEYPVWAIALGWCMTIFCIMWIPIVAAVRVVQAEGSTLWQTRLEEGWMSGDAEEFVLTVLCRRMLGWTESWDYHLRYLQLVHQPQIGVRTWNNTEGKDTGKGLIQETLLMGYSF
ncbi:uncharacterized protein LOC132820048 [Hemiscyllium ocellatum]|uniref:uncharacterized protein LOC132820048 n=1 Tax=Hemiscyllium ocellatum TaxID=170820 RepID=UPI002966B63A|nr:uncharacterized protein LOC132820048 [Hemiscyllium ocellatum]